MAKKDLFLEEAVLDDLARDFGPLEVPLSERVFKLINILTVLVVAVVVVRIFFLGVWKGNFYQDRALANAGDVSVVRTERGVILDRFNKPLVKNVPIFRLSLKIPELLKNPEEKEQTLKAVQEILGIPREEMENLIREVDLETQNSLDLDRQLSVDEVIKIKNLNLKSFQIRNDFKREYSDSEIFSHILGYVGVASKNDLADNSDLFINDVIGKTGLENYYDKELRGQDGHSIVYKNARGETVQDKLINNPQQGYELQTTIDSDFQKFFYNRLKQGITALGRNSGVGLALNPQTGEILALVSLPSFDNNKITPEMLSDSRKPLFNRVVSGLYSPGSTIKPLVAFAALAEGVVNPLEEIFSAGYIEIPNPYFPDKPSRFVDWKPQGWVNLYSAIARSSNVYFYSLGGGLPANVQPGGILRGADKIDGLGIWKLKEYWQKFGLDKTTGIDLPGENSGFLPDPDEKEKRAGEIWRIGDTYNASIGQGDLIVTPLELLNYISGIADNGKINRPFIVRKIISEDGKTIRETEQKVNFDYSASLDKIKEVQKGMIDAVKKPYGTANLLSSLSVSVAAKTGTAQIEGNQKINALFVGYAPASAEAKAGKPTDNPQIAVLVLVENAPEGILSAVPIAKDVLNWYYYNRIKQ